MWLSCVGNDVANLTVHFVGTTVVNARHQRLVSLHHKIATRLCNLTYEVCLIQITMEAIIVGCHVEIDNVTVLERSLIGNTVANDFIY